ncbi:hypothetical protein HAX54_037799, partial [Datura stramonium]|nr:hypothetical protein [Datura stramonium]
VGGRWTKIDRGRGDWVEQQHWSAVVREDGVEGRRVRYDATAFGVCGGVGYFRRESLGVRVVGFTGVNVCGGGDVGVYGGRSDGGHWPEERKEGVVGGGVQEGKK